MSYEKPGNLTSPHPDLSGQGTEVNIRTTFYAPGAGGHIEGPWATSRRNHEGEAIPRTLDDVRLGNFDYVTLASDPSNYGNFYDMGAVTYTSPLDGVTYTGDRALAERGNAVFSPKLERVVGYVHDTGSSFIGHPNYFDISLGDFRGWDTHEGSRFVDVQSYGGAKWRTWHQIDGPLSATMLANNSPQPGATQTARQEEPETRAAAHPPHHSHGSGHQELSQEEILRLQTALAKSNLLARDKVTGEWNGDTAKAAERMIVTAQMTDAYAESYKKIYNRPREVVEGIYGQATQNSFDAMVQAGALGRDVADAFRDIGAHKLAGIYEPKEVDGNRSLVESNRDAKLVLSHITLDPSANAILASSTSSTLIRSAVNAIGIKTGSRQTQIAALSAESPSA